MNSRQRTLGHAAALMTILIWGTTFVSTKVLLRDFTPVTVLFTRFVIGYAFLWCLKPRLLPLSGWKKAWLMSRIGVRDFSSRIMRRYAGDISCPQFGWRCFSS